MVTPSGAGRGSVRRGSSRISSLRGARFERFDGVDQDESGVWTTPGGDRVAWFKDPDGNILNIVED